MCDDWLAEFDDETKQRLAAIVVTWNEPGDLSEMSIAAMEDR